MGRAYADMVETGDLPPEYLDPLDPPNGSKAGQDEINGWDRGEDGSLMPPANWAVDGEGGYVFAPPAPPAGASTGEVEAAAAGMSVADWALTAEGIAFADEQEALALDQMAASNGGVFPPNTPAPLDQSDFTDEFLLSEFGLTQADYNPQTGGYGDAPPLTDEQIARAQANYERVQQLKALDVAYWNGNGNGIGDGDAFGYNEAGP
jgi:hypothetical protein